ncbi:MAG: APC family permease, partial [Blastocatellia bacterium]
MEQLLKTTEGTAGGIGAPPALRKTLRAKDYFTLAFGSMVGVGWMVVIDDWLGRGGSIGAMAGFLLGGLILFPIGYVYGHMTERMPDAASEVAYTGAVFSKAVSFGTGWMMLLAYLIVCPYEAVAIGRIGSYVFPSMNHWELYKIGGYAVFLPHVVAGLSLTAVIVGINYRGVKLSATFQNIATFGLLAIFAVFATLGLFKGDVDNLTPHFSHGAGLKGGLLSVILVLQIVPYFMTGFEAAPKCSEEAAADFDPRHYRRMIYLALGAGIFFYVVVIGVVSLIQPWPSLMGHGFATAVAFERAFKSRLLTQVIMFAVLLSLLKIFNGNFLTATRLLFAMGRRGLMDERLGSIERRYRTPNNSVLFVGAVTMLASFLGQAMLVPISEVGSLACAIGWMATCAAFCRGAGGRVSGLPLLVGVIGAVVAASLIVMKLAPEIPGSFDRPDYIALAVWVLLGLLLWWRRPAAKTV